MTTDLFALEGNDDLSNHQMSESHEFDAIQDTGCDTADILDHHCGLGRTFAGGTYVDREVCIDGNVITSRTPEDLPAFVVALMEQMRKG